jgi:alkyl hydroperoxide reductase subunit AhpC
MSVRIGKPAPDFRAQAYHNGDFTQINLSELRGRWVVLVFYPLDFTFVCPTELRAFADEYEELQKIGAEVIAISVDSVYSHKAWIERDLPSVRYPVVSDLTKAIAQTYGVLEEQTGIALRATFIIDPEGTLQYAVVAGPALGRSTEETVRVLQALQTGELCPANWRPGQKTLGATA